MTKLKIKIHPLFIVFGIFLIFIGSGYVFIAYILTALIHEYAHSFTASRFGCRTNEIILYPYGAVLYGEFSCLKPSQEAIVALAGPALNLFAAVVFTASWWVLPELYLYTDVLAMVNISIAVFNLLPVYPLDGGRILMAMLKIRLNAKRALGVVKVMGIICCLIFFGLYIYSIFNDINYNFAVISIFMAVSLMEGNQCISDVSAVMFPPNNKHLQRGVEKRTLRVSEDITLYQLFRMLSTQYYYIVEVVDSSGKIIKKIEHNNLEKIFIQNDSFTLLKDLKL